MDTQKMSNLRAEVRKVGAEKYKAESKVRLARILSTKIRTTMIGALAAIEEHLGPLWGPGEDTVIMSRMELEALYEKIRQQILDNGNNQIRNFQTELEQYDVEWLRYKITLPVRQREDKDG